MPTGSVVNHCQCSENKIGILSSQGPGINSDRESSPKHVGVIALWSSSDVKHVDRLAVNSRISSNRYRNKSSRKPRARDSYRGH